MFFDWLVFLFVLVVFSRLLCLTPTLVRELGEDLTLRHCIYRSDFAHLPKISVIIPAKDESETIVASASSILNSSYKNIELILIDDRSSDDTHDLMTRLASSDDRVKVVSVKNLPDGWTGKTHALNYAVKYASGDLFLFSDADAFFDKSLIENSVSVFVQNKLDLMSLLPSFKDAGFLEKALYPHMALGISYFYPLSEVNDPEKVESALASGCFMLISKKAYESLGGWEKFKSDITEDIAMSKAAKLVGMKVMVMLAGNQLQTKPFQSLGELIGFWVRTFYGGLEKSMRKSMALFLNYLSLVIVSVLFLVSIYGYLANDIGRTNYFLMMFTGLTVFGIFGSFSLFLKKYNGATIYSLYSVFGIALGAWIAFRVLTDIWTGKGIMWRGTRYK